MFNFMSDYLMNANKLFCCLWLHHFKMWSSSPTESMINFGKPLYIAMSQKLTIQRVVKKQQTNVVSSNKRRRFTALSGWQLKLS